MKVRSSVKPICEKCKIIKRKGSIRVRIRSTSSARVNSADCDKSRFIYICEQEIIHNDIA